jgi:hypothetical protein
MAWLRSAIRVSALAGNLLCAAEDQIVNVKHDGLVEHIRSHAPFLSVFFSLAPSKTKFNAGLHRIWLCRHRCFIHFVQTPCAFSQDVI